MALICYERLPDFCATWSTSSDIIEMSWWITMCSFGNWLKTWRVYGCSTTKDGVGTPPTLDGSGNSGRERTYRSVARERENREHARQTEEVERYKGCMVDGSSRERRAIAPYRGGQVGGMERSLEVRELEQEEETVDGVNEDDREERSSANAGKIDVEVLQNAGRRDKEVGVKMLIDEELGNEEEQVVELRETELGNEGNKKVSVWNRQGSESQENEIQRVEGN